MALTKITFTLDAGTVAKLNNTAKRQSKPKSQVVREAIAAYKPVFDRLTEEERVSMLRALGQMMRKPLGVPPKLIWNCARSEDLEGGGAAKRPFRDAGAPQPPSDTTLPHWTLNPSDFSDIPGSHLFRSPF
jgi:hypothetical protein